MPKKARVLVVDSDLHSLSRIYLSLIHKDYKVEAADDAQEIMARTERFKPRLIILHTATKNLTPEIYQYLVQKRLYVILVGAKNEDIPESGRMEIIDMPTDVAFFDSKIREMLVIVDS